VYFLIKVQKFFLARHFGQPLPRIGLRATERQYSILSASKHYGERIAKRAADHLSDDQRILRKQKFFSGKQR